MNLCSICRRPELDHDDPESCASAVPWPAVPVCIYCRSAVATARFVLYRDSGPGIDGRRHKVLAGEIRACEACGMQVANPEWVKETL